MFIIFPNITFAPFDSLASLNSLKYSHPGSAYTWLLSLLLGSTFVLTLNTGCIRQTLGSRDI